MCTKKKKKPILIYRYYKLWVLLMKISPHLCLMEWGRHLSLNHCDLDEHDPLHITLKTLDESIVSLLILIQPIGLFECNKLDVLH